MCQSVGVEEVVDRFFGEQTQLILKRGFQYEEHTVITDDGYILTIFRVISNYKRFKEKAYPILVAHGVLTNSDAFLLSCPGQLNSTGFYSELNDTIVNDCNKTMTGNTVFTLSSCGYDVWLHNSRGNHYSSKHVKHSTSSAKYWNFTLTELGVFDVKNTVEYILNRTDSEQLSYIGTSMGSTQMFVLLSLNPDFEKYIKPFVAIPPIVFLGNTQSSLRTAAYFAPILLNKLVSGLGLPKQVMQLFAELCRTNRLLRSLAQTAMYQTLGQDFGSIDNSTFVTLLAHFLDFTSSKVLLQYAQFVKDNGFHQFDYLDADINQQHYGTPTPPDYPLENIKSEHLCLYKGVNDLLEAKDDHDKLLHKLNVKPMSNALIKYFNHADFVYSCNNRRFINWNIIYNLIKSGNK